MSAFYACFGYITDAARRGKNPSERVPYVQVFDTDQGYSDPEKNKPAVIDAVAPPYHTEADAWEAAITYAHAHGWKKQRPSPPQWFEVIDLLKSAGLTFSVEFDTWGDEVSYPCVRFQFENNSDAGMAYELLTTTYPEYESGDPSHDLIVAYGERYDQQDEMWLSLELLNPPLPLSDDRKILKQTIEVLDMLRLLLAEENGEIARAAVEVINRLMVADEVPRAFEMADEIYHAYFMREESLKSYIEKYERDSQEGEEDEE